MTTEHRSWQDHEGPLLASRYGTDVIACVACGFKHAIPLPAEEDVRRFYAEEFYGGFHEDYIGRQRRDLPWWRLEFSAKFGVFEELLPRGRRRLLDVGSGAGWFLEFGSERGWQTVGIEPGQPACLHAREELGCEVVEGFFEPRSLAGLAPFDVIHLNNVLEHVPDPETILKTAASAMLEDALIAVTVPNDFNALQMALVELRGHDPWWVDPREHLNYFDRDSLDALLTRCGFSPRRHLASFPLELFALMGDDYLADPDLGPEVHRKRMTLETELHRAGRGKLLADLYGRLGEMGLGRTLTVVGVRNSGSG